MSSQAGQMRRRADDSPDPGVAGGPGLVVAPPPTGWEVRYAVPVVSAHGGSGATTVAGFLAASGPSLGALDVYDAGIAVPAAVNGAAIVITARGTAAGLVAAQRATSAVQGHHGVPIVVVVSDDGPWTLPPIVRARMRALSGRVAGIIRLPYVPAWRFEDTADNPPRRYLAQLARARGILEACGARTVGDAQP